MNNNFYEIPNDWYNEFNNTFMNNNMPNMNMPNMNNIGMPFINNNMSNMNNLADPKTGHERGNLFNNLYDPYKNYKYRELRPKDKREDLLFNIMRHAFVLTELDLYLDVNPNDTNMLGLYDKISNAKKSLVDTYEKSYGPLTLDGENMGMNKWNWISSPWPWEVSR